MKSCKGKGPEEGKAVYNKNMEKHRAYTDFSTLTGIVMLIFMLAALTNRKLLDWDFHTFLFSISFPIDSLTLTVPLAAMITVLGMVLILKKQLGVSRGQIELHLFLPFAVTLTIGFALRNAESMLSVWMLLGLAGLLLYLVLRFEFDACDPASASYPASVIVLSGLCYAVFLLFITAMRANVFRLSISLPAIFLLSTVIALKIYSFYLIHLDIPLHALVTGCVTVFAAAGLHYWPINIVFYGAMMFLWYYCFVHLVIDADSLIPMRISVRRLLPAVLPALILMGYAYIHFQ